MANQNYQHLLYDVNTQCGGCRHEDHYLLFEKLKKNRFCSSKPRQK